MPRCVYARQLRSHADQVSAPRVLGYPGRRRLLDPDTNMTYAVNISPAPIGGGGDADRAVALYARGYNSNDGRATARRSPRFASPCGRVWYRAGDLSIAARRRTAWVVMAVAASGTG